MELFVLSSVLKHVSGARRLTEGSRSAHMGKFELEKTLEVGVEFGTDTSIGKYAVHFSYINVFETKFQPI